MFDFVSGKNGKKKKKKERMNRKLQKLDDNERSMINAVVVAEKRK